MKKLLIVTVIFVSGLPLCAQQGVAISTAGSSPHSSAMLDVQSNNKGFLLPRMTTAQRNAISSPANGLLVYDTEQGMVYQRDGQTWRGMLNTTHWNRSATRNFLFNTPDSLGIGTSTPDEKVEIYNGKLRLTTPSSVDENMILFHAGSPISGSWAKDQGFRFYRNGNWVGTMRHIASSNNGNSIRFSMRNSSSGDLTINDQGQVGIGTQFPANPFSINAYGIPGETVHISDDDDPMIQLKTLGVDKAFMQVSGNDFRIGTNSSNSAGRVILRNGAVNRLIVDEDGLVGIGTESIAAKLHINSGSSNASLRLQGNSNPSLQFYQGTTSIGSIQAGTSFLSILAPNKLLRLNNNLYVDDATNRVGVGTSAPDERLHVSGNAKVSTGKVLNNNDENLLPIGFAAFNGSTNGTKRAGTANVTGGWIGEDFSLDVAGVNINEAILLITPRNAKLMPTYRPGPNGSAIINFYDSDGDLHGPAFSVVVFKAN